MDLPGILIEQGRKIVGRGEKDARLAALTVEIGGNDVVRGGKRLRRRKKRAAAVGQQVAARGACAPLSNAVGIGPGEQSAGFNPHGVLRRNAQAPAKRLRQTDDAAAGRPVNRPVATPRAVCPPADRA